MSRRRWLAGTSALLGSGLVGLSPAARPGVGPRVVVVGGGLAGIACAWLLSGAARVTVLEARSRIGGHADTVEVEGPAGVLAVDLGAQFFAERPHPTYVALLRLLGLLDAGAPSGDAVVDAEMTITVATTGAARPVFLSPASGRYWPLLAGWNLPALWTFLVLSLSARRLDRDGDADLTVQDWLTTLPVSVSQRDAVVLPLVGAMIGCSLEQARGLSARSALAFIAQALPERLLDPVRYSNSTVGLGGVVEILAGDTGVDVRTGTSVRAIEALPGGGYRVHARGTSPLLADVVVMATPAHAAAPLLREVPGLARVAGALGALEYFPTEVVIHRDPAYVPGWQGHWSAYNVLAGETHSEASVWYGAIREVPPGGAPWSVFKSWASARENEPRDRLFRRAFLHPLITPEYLALGRRLGRLEGVRGIWLAGSYLGEVDSQETALRSAMAVARGIAPGAANLTRLDGAAAAVRDRAAR